MNRYLLIVILVITSLAAKADIRQYWDTMPDTLLIHKTDSAIQQETDIYIHAVMSSTHDVQLRLMPSSQSGSVICMVRTYSAPERESVVEVYDTKWHLLRPLAFSLSDVVGADNVSRVGNLFEPLLLSVQLNADTEDITLSLSTHFLSDDEKQQLHDIPTQVTLSWSQVVAAYSE